jgi:hypothetical protein
MTRQPWRVWQAPARRAKDGGSGAFQGKPIFRTTARGIMNERDQPLSAASIASMLTNRRVLALSFFLRSELFPL